MPVPVHGACRCMGRKMREGSQETLPKSEIIRRVAVPVEATSCSQALPPRLTREVGAAAAVEEVSCPMYINMKHFPVSVVLRHVPLPTALVSCLSLSGSNYGGDAVVLRPCCNPFLAAVAASSP